MSTKQFIILVCTTGAFAFLGSISGFLWVASVL